MHTNILLSAVTAILLAGAATAGTAPNVTVIATEVNGNVVLTFSGSIDTTNLTFVRDNKTFYGVVPGFYSNPTFKGVTFWTETPVSQYSGTSSFSPNTFNPTDASFLSGVLVGDLFGANGSTTGGTGNFFLPAGYVSGTALSGTVTFEGTTLADLNATTDASITIGDQTVAYDVQLTPVPVPASLPLMVAGLGGLALAARRRRS